MDAVLAIWLGQQMLGYIALGFHLEAWKESSCELKHIGDGELHLYFGHLHTWTAYLTFMRE